jgi:hypothetical protein
MVGASIAVWLAATAIVGARTGVDLLAGMVGPLAVAASTCVMIERTYRRHPGRLTSLMITAFGVKMVFFGAYVSIALLALSLRPIPFVTSFIGYFIGLYVTEALYLRRLFTGERLS